MSFISSEVFTGNAFKKVYIATLMNERTLHASRKKALFKLVSLLRTGNIILRQFD